MMKKSTSSLILALFVLAAILSQGSLLAQSPRKYNVTITNVTRSQIFSPPVVVSHRKNLTLFQVGAPALPELVEVAEDGDATNLIGFLSAQPEVFDFVAAAGPVLPGESVTLGVDASHPNKISVVGMLVTTNDAFFGLDRAPLSFRRMAEMHDAVAYDAGSEANTESCDFIPGPPCGSGGVRDTGEAEGYVYVHPGISGVGDLEPANFDWRNPVAQITIQRTN